MKIPLIQFSASWLVVAANCACLALSHPVRVYSKVEAHVGDAARVLPVETRQRGPRARAPKAAARARTRARAVCLPCAGKAAVAGPAWAARVPVKAVPRPAATRRAGRARSAAAVRVRRR